MKGVIFNIAEEVVTRDHGPAAWDALLEDIGFDGVYTSLGLDPDGEFVVLVHAAAARLGLPEQEVVLHFGREAAGIFAVRHPDLFVAHGGTRGFVLHLNDVIHPEVRKLHPGADAPDFGYTVLGPDVVELTYTTRRRLCHLAHGLVEGTPAGDEEALARGRAGLTDAVAAMREALRDIHPPALDHVGPAGALSGLAAQERRRGAADVTLVVADDGCGIAPGRLEAALADGHLGIASSFERAAAAGGRMTVAANDPGARVEIVLPLAVDEHSAPSALGYPS